MTSATASAAATRGFARRRKQKFRFRDSFRRSCCPSPRRRGRRTSAHQR
ncbi:MAG: hypothetical protein EPN38_07815 [Rhodanobacteraceae bacterium]|nr:MAG: hypothetical protein EPN38_07815 [Rhodanobacteraceae bacterium]